MGISFSYEQIIQISDRRFVPFLGHCFDDKDEKFLVYRYTSNADLSCALFKKPDDHNDRLPSLDWIIRSKIAIGVADGLVFLHAECAPPLVHGYTITRFSLNLE
ncbi:unnamed protein product [Fraxinus pennsylvanica]|uniref:Protein kinase domain-containing protein n=1 Tax=Fraxinus pennsylvanica TaxID=56036 RepID=A0AAD2E7Q2_9LAMI|nr:unnamed protein product [Fraxinus pennsylvanica]